MLRIFSTHRLFTFLLTGLMITSCGGGTNSGDTNPQPPQTLTVRVPSLNYAQTITKSTTINDITAARRDLSTQCTLLGTNPFGSVVQACVAEVETAYNQAVAFIRS
jgi:hypothetical protein